VFERFSEDARLALVAAQEEARVLRHESVRPEHLLLGVMLQTEPGFALAALERAGIKVDRVRERLVELGAAEEDAVAGQIPFTPDAKKLLENTLREALALGHNFIGPEHVLLGVLREPGGAAARLLADLGAKPEVVRDEVVRITQTPEYAERRPPAGPAAGELAKEPAAREQFDAVVGVALTEAFAMARREGRPLDAGDLFIALAETAPLPQAALARTGVDIDVLRDAVAEARR
jgi:ATP-dependent Clp protease ATP-binding subunit ClpC